MENMHSPSKDQVSPAPWLEIHNQLNVPMMIGKVLMQSPNATVDEVVEQFRKWHVQVSGVIVSMWLARGKRSLARIRAASELASDDRKDQSSEAEFYCMCDQQPCACDKSAIEWWRQYCCGVRITATQAEQRDKFFQHTTTP